MGPTPNGKSKKQHIRDVLESSFPGHKVPTGGFAAIAKQTGASRALVSVVANETGWVAAQPVSRRARAEGCIHCAGAVEPGKRVCRQCAVVTLTCDGCGRLFERLRERVLERERDSRYHGGTYCSRRCYLQRRQASPGNERDRRWPA
jgi:hypothetical protein